MTAYGGFMHLQLQTKKLIRLSPMKVVTHGLEQRRTLMQTPLGFLRSLKVC